MLKRYLAICLSIVLCFNFMLNADAASVNEENYSIETRVVNNQIIRRLEINENAATYSRSANTMDTEEMLLEMGMDEIAVNNLSADDLQSYSEAQGLVSVTTYYIIDGEGNSTIVPETEALAAPGAENEYDGQDTFQNSVIRVWHAYQDFGSGYYRLVTDTRWLAMPFFRGVDFVGSAAQGMAVDDTTAEGYCSYTLSHYYAGILMDERTYTSPTYDEDDFELATGDTFTGLGMRVGLPSDTVNDYQSYLYTDYFVHTEFFGCLNEPNSVAAFNTTGSYVHTYASLPILAELTVSSSGGVDGALGLGASISHTTYAATIFVER